ncbi:MAG: hypothetical protein LUD02_13165 [Tannerellaceae bacterium]|nr:hypothetical protein [Tannerellaceae bacterium]MCD8264977.1 hypothetical protein [Tannerellaceae bacterium]
MKVVINPCYQASASYIASIPERFEKEGELVYSGRNQLRQFIVDGKKLVVKRFKLPHIINRFAYVTVRTSKACRSYEYAARLLAEQIHTPAPVAYMETYTVGLSYSYYVSEELEDMHELRIFEKESGHPDQQLVMEGLGKFTAMLHEKKILHKDYSGGNVLYKIDAGQRVSFVLVDLNRMNFNKPVSEAAGYKNLERLAFPDEAYTQLALAYAKERGFDGTYAVEQVLKYKNNYRN